MFSPEQLGLLEKASIKLGISASEHRGIIFVYCPPKVGSTSLVSFLRIFASHKYILLHIHDESTLKVLFNITEVTITNIIQYNASRGREVYVIDVYRSPVERKTSPFFEELSSIHFNNTEENLNTYDVEKVIQRFNKVFPYIGAGDHYLEKYGIEKSEIPGFDFSKKMMLIEKNGVKYVKLRLKDSSNWGDILSDLLKIEIIVRPAHETGKKALGELYEKFKKTYKIPENLLRLIVEDVSLETFYSKEERDAYIKKWSTTVTLPCSYYTPEEEKIYREISVENSLHLKIKYDHYLDNGCICVSCASRRKKTKMSVKSGVGKIERIVHTPPPQKSMSLIYK